MTKTRGRRKASVWTRIRRAGAISDRGWQRQFEDPIDLPGGRRLVTLKDAADHIMRLSKAEQNLQQWQAVVEALIMVAERRGPLLHARVGMLRAMNHGVERVFNSNRKDTHWGRRKLKRDE
jgi:hypothetical protein